MFRHSWFKKHDFLPMWNNYVAKKEGKQFEKEIETIGLEE